MPAHGARERQPTEADSYIGRDDPQEAERQVAHAEGVADELSTAFALHPPTSAPRIVELGCGAGLVTRALLDALPGASILATDRDERLLQRARERLADAVHAGRVRFERADATNLPFAARSFDLAVCRCLLMHLADPLLAVAEMYRVLDVGGVAAVVEPDWGARALYPDGEALAALLDLGRRARSFGFPDLMMGRKLYALFRAAGFGDVHIAVMASGQTAADLATMPEDERAQHGPARLLDQARATLHAAGIIDAEIDTLIARLVAIRRHPEYFSAAMDFAASGIKPAPPLADVVPAREGPGGE
jgi:SAM-dependent methyltransferase